ncbi:MAG TPA: hypothetical protein VFG50_03925 [Rhodothermales bacterium]|nr:hypothetical protein [Rhodothermales bacterium]
MLLVRDVFHCKPGKANALINTFQKTLPLFQKQEGMRNARILVDLVADYWTVVLETEVDDISVFAREMETSGDNQEIRQAMQGYMDNVEGGHREIFRIYQPASA